MIDSRPKKCVQPVKKSTFEPSTSQKSIYSSFYCISRCLTNSTWFVMIFKKNKFDQLYGKKKRLVRFFQRANPTPDFLRHFAIQYLSQTKFSFIHLNSISLIIFLNTLFDLVLYLIYFIYNDGRKYIKQCTCS